MICAETILGVAKRDQEGKGVFIMFEPVLLEAKESKVPISLYTDSEDKSKFTFGFILGISDDDVLLGSITPYGFYDGYTIRHLDDIYRVEKGDSYGLRVSKLYKIHSQGHPPLSVTGDFVQDVLSFSCEYHLVVSIELMNSGYDDIQGFVSSVQGPMVVIEQVNDDGEFDGDTVVSIDDITCITCDSEKESAVKLLSENR